MNPRQQWFRPGRRIQQIGKLAALPFFSRRAESAAPDAPQVAQPGRPPGFLPRLAENTGAVFSILVSSVLIAAIAALLYAFAHEIRRDTIDFEGFTAPKELVDRGYTSSVIAEEIITEIRKIQAAAETTHVRRQLESATAIPDIQVSGSGLSMKSIVRYGRRLLSLPDNRVDGKLVQDGATLRLALTLREGKRVEVLEVRRDDGDVPRLLRDAGRALVQAADGYVLARYLESQEESANHFPETLAAIDYILAHPPASDHAWAYNMLGRIRQKEGKPEAALEAFRKAAADPAFPFGHGAYAAQLTRMGRIDEATAYARSRIRMAKTREDWAIVFSIQHDLGDWRALVDAARHEVELEPQSVDAYDDLLHGLGHAHRYKEALAEADRALAFAHDNLALLNYRAEALTRLGRAAEALDAANVAIEKAAVVADKSGIANAYISRAVVQLALGKPGDALADFQRVIDGGRTVSDLTFDYGDMLIAVGRPRDALDFFLAKIAESPRIWDAHVGAARAHAALGDHEEAARRFELTAKGDPDDPALYRDWAKTLEALGRPDGAAVRRADADRAEARLSQPLALR